MSDEILTILETLKKQWPIAEIKLRGIIKDECERANAAIARAENAERDLIEAKAEILECRKIINTNDWERKANEYFSRDLKLAAEAEELKDRYEQACTSDNAHREELEKAEKERDLWKEEAETHAQTVLEHGNSLAYLQKRVDELKLLAEKFEAKLLEIKERIIDNPTYSNQIVQAIFSEITKDFK